VNFRGSKTVRTPQGMSDPSSSSSSRPSDEGAFERWRKDAAWVTGLGLSPEEELSRSRMQAQNQKTIEYKKCEETKANLLTTSPAVVFMLKHMALLGYPITSRQIVCEPCTTLRSGGFSSKDGGILICQDHMMSKTHMEDTLIHELVHAYDRAKFEVDFSNCRHVACTEIRASNLSGDCKWTREVSRGFISFSKQHQACVKRRAIKSVRANPACSGPGVAEQAVQEVWESCFPDTRPFDEIF